MSLIKHMEAVFVVTLGLACSASYVLDTLPEARAVAPTAIAASAATPAEKLQSLEEERKLASIRAGSRT
jgi:hypothetical protein